LKNFCLYCHNPFLKFYIVSIIKKDTHSTHKTLKREFHKLACDELNNFDYEKFKARGFEVEKLGDYPIELKEKPETT